MKLTKEAIALDSTPGQSRRQSPPSSVPTLADAQINQAPVNEGVTRESTQIQAHSDFKWVLGYMTLRNWH